MTITLGKFTVRSGLRPDNPAFPVYLVFIGARLVGKSFSMPDLECCLWLERQGAVVLYAERSATLKTYSANRRRRAA